VGTLTAAASGLPDDIRVPPVPSHLISDVNAALASVPADAPACVFGVTEWEQGTGYSARVGVMARVGDRLSFVCWADKGINKPLGAGAAVLWYPGRH
jgi:hypothetical protein